MGTGTQKKEKGLLGEDEDVEAFIAKWKVDADTAKRLRSAKTDFGGMHAIDDVDQFSDEFGISEEGRKTLRKAYDADLEKDLPPAPPPPPDLTDELLVKSRMAQGSKTRTAQGVASTFLVGKTKVGG